MKRTLKQIEASRRNGANSRGPNTAAGRIRSSLNALTHGLTSRMVVLESEDERDFSQLLAAYIEIWQPANRHELDLVNDIAAARWRLCRNLSLEAANLDLEIGRQHPDFHRLGQSVRCAMAYNTLELYGKINNLNRQEVRLRRTVERATNELRLLQQQRQKRRFQNEPENLQAARAEQLAVSSQPSGLPLMQGGAATSETAPN